MVVNILFDKVIKHRLWQGIVIGLMIGLSITLLLCNYQVASISLPGFVMQNPDAAVDKLSRQLAGYENTIRQLEEKAESQVVIQGQLIKLLTLDR